MKVKSVMSSHVVTIRMDDPVSKAKDIFDEKGFHHLLVLEHERLFGVISDRDLLKSISPKVGTVAATSKDLATLNKRVHQIMTRKPLYLNENATVGEAIKLFNGNKISCIPIVNNDNMPVGIVSWRDIMKILGEKLEQH